MARVTVEGLKELRRKVQKMKPGVRKALRPPTRKSALVTRRNAKAESPEDTRRLKRSLKFRVVKSRTAVLQKVFSTVPYAFFAEVTVKNFLRSSFGEQGNSYKRAVERAFKGFIERSGE